MNFLYQIFILPLRYFLEVVFKFLLKVSGHNVPITIIGMSICVSVVILPIYLKAEDTSSSRKKEFIDKWTKHINKSFRGEERMMMKAFFYSEMGVNMSEALKNTVFIILQIPFFLAAYSFLAEYFSINTGVFLLGVNLSEPDRLLAVGSLSLNLFPVLMTIVNVLAAFAYNIRNKAGMVQPVITAVIFFILLYNSPAGLVLYWLTNNVITLFKNLIILFYKRSDNESIDHEDKNADEFKMYICCMIALWMLMGVVIPADTIASSPLDYVDIYHYTSPMHYIGVTLKVYFGLFLVYGSCIYICLRERYRKKMGVIMSLLLAMSCVNYALWGRKLGTISPELVYDNGVSFSIETVTAGFIICVVIIPIVYYLFKNHKKIVFRMIPVIMAVMIIFGGFRIIQTMAVLRQHKENSEVVSGADDEECLFTFSKTGKNVLVIMLDRAVGALLPYVFEERPELREKYSGFTYYPDTLSMGGYTRLGQPALYGGYDYCVSSLADSKGKTYADRCDEELLLLPTLFSQHGYRVYMSDDPIGLYHSTPWGQLYQELPDVNAYRLEGRYADFADMVDIDIERNFVLYSIFRTCIPSLAEKIYDKGVYMAITQSSMVERDFYNAYTALEKLPDITASDDSGQGTLVMLCSHITHSPCYLQRPDYTPAVVVDNSGFDEYVFYTTGGKKMTVDEKLEQHYQVYVAAMITVGEWMDKLKELGVYDNTRIIIAADHGWSLGLIDIDLEGEDATKMNPLLMVKDFNSNNEFSVSDEYMTNADVPYIALEGIVEDPVNPFTGNSISMDGKNDKVMVPFSALTSIDPFSMKDGRPVVDVSDAAIYTVHDSIFNADNWEKVR